MGHIDHSETSVVCCKKGLCDCEQGVSGCLLSFRVIDLGVMVPCDKILREAITHKAGKTE